MDLGHDKFKLKSGPESVSRHNRTVVRQENRKKLEAANTLIALHHFAALDKTEDISVDQEVDENNNIKSQTWLTGTEIVSMEEELEHLTVKNVDLQQQLSQYKLIECGLRNNNELANFLTGLPTY